MNEHDRRALAPKSKPVDDVPFVREWRERHHWCAACGRDGPITVHHIIGGRGGRSDEACNLLALCWDPCHQLAEGLDIRVPTVVPGYWFMSNKFPGGLLPKITLGHALMMKWRADPKEYDAARLAVLHGRTLPEPEETPAFLWKQFLRNRPEMFQLPF